jgi:outer membrane autotransporter protein
LDGAVQIGGGGGKADIDGFIIDGGFDVPVSDRWRIGVSLALAQASAKLRNTPETTHTNSFGGAAYANYDHPDGWFVNAFAGDSAQTMRLSRDAVVGGTTFHLTAHTDGDSPMGGVQVGKFYDTHGVRLAPALGLQYQRSAVSGYTESGGIAALTVNSFGVEEFDLRAGVDAYGRLELGDVVLKPNLHAFVVDNVDGRSPPLQAAFVAAPATLLSFQLESTGPRGNFWGELGIGAQLDLGASTTLGVRYDASVGRSESRYGAWTGSLRIVF